MAEKIPQYLYDEIKYETNREAHADINIERWAQCMEEHPEEEFKE